MPFTITVHHDPSHLLVVAAGPACLADLCGLADLAAGIAAGRGYRRVLIDLLAVAPDLSFTEHLHLGAHGAAVLASVERIATVVPAPLRTGTSEKAARKSGANLATFTTVDEALAWLLATPGPAATR